MIRSDFLNWSHRGIRWLIGLVFLWAGVSKLLNPGSFALLIDSYGLVPSAWSLPIAVLLPVAEVITAIGLVFGKRWALHGITGMTVLFITILLYGINLGLNVDSGVLVPVTRKRKYNGAAWAVKLSYTNVYRHAGGIFAWKGAKFKTDSL